MSRVLARAVYGSLGWFRYLGASVIALAADTGTFLALLTAGTPAFTASAVGYCLGIAIHWLVSSRLVFAAQVKTGRERRVQQAEFALSALAGLVTTQAIIWATGHFAYDPRAGKLVAIVVSFQLTYLLRRRFVFA